MAPFYLGLVVALGALLFVFLRELVHEIGLLPEMNAEGAILMALSLIDMSLAGNLMLIVIFSGYENFVSRFDVDDLADRPADGQGRFLGVEAETRFVDRRDLGDSAIACLYEDR